jgi:hypothetical protein
MPRFVAPLSDMREAEPRYSYAAGHTSNNLPQRLAQRADTHTHTRQLQMSDTSLFLQLGTAGLSCACSQSTVHWTETTMVRQQLAKGAEAGNLFSMTARIARTEGVKGLYRGYSAAMLREMTYSSIRFGLYDPIKVLLGATDPKNTPFYKKVAAGLSAGAFAASLMSPTDLLKIRMQKQTGEFHSMGHHARQIISEPPGGVRNLYHGVFTTITRAAVLGATKMATYDQCKFELKREDGYFGWKEEGLGRYKVQFSASIVTGLAVSLTTSPVTNARTHIMSAPPGTYSSTFHCWADIIRTQGPLGLYRGFGAQWARFGPYAIVQFLVWEQLRKAVGMKSIGS